MFIVLVNIQMNEYTNNNKDTDILFNIQKHQEGSNNHQYFPHMYTFLAQKIHFSLWSVTKQKLACISKVFLFLRFRISFNFTSYLFVYFPGEVVREQWK